MMKINGSRTSETKNKDILRKKEEYTRKGKKINMIRETGKGTMKINGTRTFETKDRDILREKEEYIRRKQKRNIIRETGKGR